MGKLPSNAGEPDTHIGKHVAAYGIEDSSTDAFQCYVRDIGWFAQLTPEEERDLAKRAQAGDQQARRHLVESNLRLVIAIARRYAGSGVPLDDLIQEGNLALMHAAEKYDWRRECRFGTYAVWWMRQAMSRATLEQSRLIHLPDHVASTLRKVRRIAVELMQDMGTEPSAQVIASAMGLPVDMVEDVLALAANPVSLDTPAEPGTPIRLVETLEDRSAQPPVEAQSTRELHDMLERALAHLTPRERTIITLRYGLADGRTWTSTDIGTHLGLSRERVRHIEVMILEKLRRVVASLSTYPDDPG